MKKILCLFTIALIFVTKITAQDSKTKEDYYEKDYAELTFLLGATLTIPVPVDDTPVGYSLGIQFVQTHSLAGRFGFIDLPTGLDFQYDCLYNENARNCLIKLGVIGSLRFPFYLGSSFLNFLELFLDIKPGIAYSMVDVDLISVESKGNGFLGYTTFQTGIIFGGSGWGSIGPNFSLFYSFGTILSRELREEDIIFFQGFNIALAFRF